MTQNYQINLSPAAQAVLDAYRSSHLTLNNLASALEALADQVVPENYDCSVEDIGWYHAAEVRHTDIRDQILTIAAELRGTAS